MKEIFKNKVMIFLAIFIFGALLLNSYNIEQETKQNQQQEKSTIQK